MNSFNLKRWIRWIALAIVFAFACGFLANWQLNRREQVVKVIQRVERNYDHQRVRLSVMVPRPTEFKLSREYRRVWVAGSYVPTPPILIRNRPLDGVQGFEQLMAFRLENGRVIYVDRGWLATGDNPSVPAKMPLPSAGHMLLVGRLKQAEPLDSRSAPTNQAQSITPSALAEQARLQTPAKFGSAGVYLASYLLLEQESLKGPTGTLTTKPSLDEGNHLSYAFQWVIFAVMAFAAIGWGIRQEKLQARAAADPTFVIKKRRRVGDADKAAEDALLGD